MKTMKKLTALVVALVMALAMTTTAFAATITVTGDKATGHTYEIYQIIKGTYDSTTKKLSDVSWGAQAADAEADVDAALLELGQVTSTDNNVILAAVTPYVNLEGEPLTTVAGGATANVADGYYLIKDVDTQTKNVTLYLVQVGGDIAIAPKADTPTFEKKVIDTNDTTGETSGLQDSADYDIGDDVPFQLKATVAADYANYKTYMLKFHDKADSTLGFNNDVVVSVDGTPIESGYTVNTNCKDGCTFEVVIAECKDIAAIKAGSVVTVDFTAELKDNAVLGNGGNVNGGKLEYSNNPNNEQKGENQPTDETPWDNVIVFTYKVVVDKVNQAETPLPGAEFTLEKVLKDGSKELITVVKSEEGTEFTFKGLDDGDYVLTETEAPTGYNKIDPITFTVTANHDVVWTTQAQNAVLKELTGNAASGEITFTPDVAEGSLDTTVINKAGSTLPTTGGAGTTVIYIVGAILVLGAGVLLITRRRLAK